MKHTATHYECTNTVLYVVMVMVRFKSNPAYIYDYTELWTHYNVL